MSMGGNPYLSGGGTAIWSAANRIPRSVMISVRSGPSWGSGCGWLAMHSLPMAGNLDVTTGRSAADRPEADGSSVSSPVMRDV